MRVAVMTAPGEVGVQDYAEPTIVKPNDAIIALSGLRPLLTTRPWTPIRRSRFSAVHHPTQGNDLREARSKEHPCPT
jgi:hypothetical protein